MTDRIALGLGLLIVLMVGLDAFLYGSDHFIFLGKKLMAFIEWLAFWR